MLYFISAFMIFILFLYLQSDGRSSSKLLLGTGLFYTFSMMFLMLYLSKDIQYYYIIENYFQLPNVVWKFLMFAPISKANIFRLLNFFALSTIFVGLRFSLTYNNALSHERFIKGIKGVVGGFLILEFVLYDPLIEKGIYLLTYPRIFNELQYEKILEIINIFTININVLIVILSIGNLFLCKKRIYSFPYFKYFAMGESIEYTLIMISYLIVLSRFPIHPIRYSKIASYTSYNSLELYKNNMLYKILPWYLFVAFIIMGISVFTIALFSHRIQDENFSISSHISAANTTSKAFCHYMKNELLSLRAEMQLIEVNEENKDDITHIISRCNNLYDRLDVIHRSTKESQLSLENTNLEILISELITSMDVDLAGYDVQIDSPVRLPYVFVDRTYFMQAIHNVINNSLDAMRDMPEGEKKLTFVIRFIDQWVSLTITDNGPGISPQNLTHIFEPFFSSSPIAEHWGIGLTVTHQIIEAHKGKITIESKQGIGTKVQILLPDFEYIMKKES